MKILVILNLNLIIFYLVHAKDYRILVEDLWKITGCFYNSLLPILFYTLCDTLSIMSLLTMGDEHRETIENIIAFVRFIYDLLNFFIPTLFIFVCIRIHIFYLGYIEISALLTQSCRSRWVDCAISRTCRFWTRY